MGIIDYKSIYDKNKEGWKDLTDNPQKYEELLAGHYSDCNHFVYELLQNAEDECANKVLIEYRNDELVFYHNGEPFDYDDVKGVSSMLMGTKDKTSGQTIGRFGMGFKSVFKYTDEPYIYSDKESFKIEKYLLPVEINDDWDYLFIKDALKIKLSNGKWYHPFYNDEHLTKIVIPFRKKDKNNNVIKIDGKEVLEKLKRLTGEILLFLTHIKELIWINKNNNEYARITISNDENDEHIITCRIEKNGIHGKDKFNRFLKYKRIFDHCEMNSSEVSIAYSLNMPATRVSALEDRAPVWVYFPTQELTDLPFYIHGSFETAVSREKLMSPSKFNSDLKDVISDLIAESLEDLAKRKMITQDFIRTVLMKAFEDEESIKTIPGLKNRITKAFKQKALLPDLDMNYHVISEMEIAIPFEIADFRNIPMFSESFNSGKRFVAFNNEQQKYFGAYYSWLRDELGIKGFTLSDWLEKMGYLSEKEVESSTLDQIDKFYSLLTDYRISLFETGKAFSRYGQYGSAIKEDLPLAWSKLKTAPVVLNMNMRFVPAYINEKQNIYLNSSSNYKSINKENIVYISFCKKYEMLFSETMNISEFDNYQYVKEKVLRKYINIDDYIKFDNEDFEKEHIEDIQQLLSLLDEIKDDNEVAKLVENASIIKILDEGNTFALPNTVYIPESDEGIDLKIYFSKIKTGMNNSSKTYLNEIDFNFYVRHNVPVSKLKRLGIITSPIIDGPRQNLEGKGDNYWKALGDYCPFIQIRGLYENIEYIEKHEEDQLSYTKSAQLLKLLLSNAYKLKGKIRKRKINPYEEEGVSTYIEAEPNSFMFIMKNGYKSNVYSRRWVYDRGYDLKSPRELSRHDINSKIYNGINSSKENFDVIGFIKNDGDKQFEALEAVSTLEKRDKKKILRQLAKELGYELSEKKEEYGETAFNPENFVSDEFPIRYIKNMDMLIRHVRQEFFCADPVKYEKVFRQIRTSYTGKINREYILGMYTNESGYNVCQICKDTVSSKHIEAIEIAHFGIEMPQLRLCLCKNCAVDYKKVRNNDGFIRSISKLIRKTKITDKMPDYSIKVSEQVTVHFTQTHLAEIREILSLIYFNGIPSKDSDKKYEKTVGHINSRGENPIIETPPKIMPKDDLIVTAGMKIMYKNTSNGKETCIIVNPELLLHKLMIGKKVGDVISFKNNKYKIVEING